MGIPEMAGGWAKDRCRLPSGARARIG